LSGLRPKRVPINDIPGIIIFIIAWRVLMSNDDYKEWIKLELFEGTIYSGKWSDLIFGGIVSVSICYVNISHGVILKSKRL
jgi:hypothetical protein